MSVVETCLIYRLPELLSEGLMWDLSEEEIKSIASESDASRKERERLTGKLALLGEGLAELNKLEKQFGPSKPQLSVSLPATYQ